MDNRYAQARSLNELMIRVEEAIELCLEMKVVEGQ
jgi:predicted RNase H-like HicB family nuclease